jgi:hypothetical protein
MSIKLPYETKAGYFSEAATYSQAIEHLRLAAECMYAIGHHKKANDENLIGLGFLAVGQMLEKVVMHVTDLATKGIRQ